MAEAKASVVSVATVIVSASVVIVVMNHLSQMGQNRNNIIEFVFP